MGGGESKTETPKTNTGKIETRYEYVDNTQLEREAARVREQNRLRNERRQKELAEQQQIEKDKREAAERERQLFLAKLDQEKHAEEEIKRREEQKKEKERQRQLELEQEAAKKRGALFDYVFGDKTNLASFRGLDISDVKRLRIGVFGPTGSGKSCFINTCERAVRETEKGTVPAQSSGSEGTIILQDFLTEMKFSLVDTRGFFNYDSDEGGEFSDILYGRLKNGDFIRRDKNEPEYDSSSTDAPFNQWLHGIILVVKANDPRLEKGGLRDYLNPIRQLLRPRGISPVTVVTHRDTLKTVAACEQALELASAATGSSTSHTFFVANYCDSNNKRNVDTELQIFDILHFAILTAERYVKIAKQQKRNREEGEMERALENVSIGAMAEPTPNASVKMFLDVLQCKFKWTEESVKKVVKQLQEEDICTLETLAESWTDVSNMFPLGMRKTVQKHLQGLSMI